MMSAQTIFLNRLSQAARAIKSESGTEMNELVKRISQLADKNVRNHNAETGQTLH